MEGHMSGVLQKLVSTQNLSRVTERYFSPVPPGRDNGMVILPMVGWLRHTNLEPFDCDIRITIDYTLETRHDYPLYYTVETISDAVVRNLVISEAMKMCIICTAENWFQQDPESIKIQGLPNNQRLIPSKGQYPMEAGTPRTLGRCSRLSQACFSEGWTCPTPRGSAIGNGALHRTVIPPPPLDYGPIWQSTTSIAQRVEPLTH